MIMLTVRADTYEEKQKLETKQKSKKERTNILVCFGGRGKEGDRTQQRCKKQQIKYLNPNDSTVEMEHGTDAPFSCRRGSART